MPRLNRFNQWGAFVFVFSYLWFYFSLSHTHNLSLGWSQITLVWMFPQLSLWMHNPIALWEHAFRPYKEGKFPQCDCVKRIFCVIHGHTCTHRSIRVPTCWRTLKLKYFGVQRLVQTKWHTYILMLVAQSAWQRWKEKHRCFDISVKSRSFMLCCTWRFVDIWK